MGKDYITSLLMAYYDESKHIKIVTIELIGVNTCIEGRDKLIEMSLSSSLSGLFKNVNKRLQNVVICSSLFEIRCFK